MFLRFMWSLQYFTGQIHSVSRLSTWTDLVGTWDKIKRYMTSKLFPVQIVHLRFKIPCPHPHYHHVTLLLGSDFSQNVRQTQASLSDRWKSKWYYSYCMILLWNGASDLWQKWVVHWRWARMRLSPPALRNLSHPSQWFSCQIIGIVKKEFIY